MKILLTAINSKYIHSNLAVHSLKAYTKDSKEEIKIREFTINQRVEEILKEIYKEKADVIAFSCYIWNLDIILQLSVELKKVCPSTKIWVGGPEVTYDAPLLLANQEQLDLVIVGEGEAVFRDLVEHCDNLAAVAGIVYRDESGAVITNPARILMDMNEIPFVYKDMDIFEHKIIYYETSRGCPFLCSYCLSSIEHGVRFRDFALVEKELAFFIEQKVTQVKFVDRTFNCNKQHTMKIWNYIKDHDNGITNFHFEIAADLLDREELELLKTLRPGLVQLEIGVQSTYEPTIKEIDRVMNLSELYEIVREINSYGNIHQHLDLIVGLPYEGYDRFKVSFNDVHMLKPNQLQLGFLKVLKGSKIHRLKDEYGIGYQSHSPYEVLFTNWVDFSEVLRLKGIEEMVEVYYNSSQFQQSLHYVLRFFDTPFDFYEALADYYEEQGLNELKHTRLARYDILRAFAMQIPDISLLALEQLLLYDLYIREKIKKRPEWAPIDELHKKQNKQLKVSGKMTHVETFLIDLLKTQETGDVWTGEQTILFDYGERDSLNHDAKTTYIGG